MRAGELRIPVTVQQRSTTRDAVGGQSTDWADIKEVRVGIRPLYGWERMSARSLAPEITHEIVAWNEPLWADPKANATYRIVYGARLFNIHAVLEEGPRRESVRILASEGLNDG